MFTYLTECYANRVFCLALASSDLRKRYRRSTLGLAWAMLQPCALAGVITLVLHRAFQTVPQDYFLYVLTGFCFWSFIGQVISAGCSCVTNASPYILERRVPLAIYPLRQTLVAGFEIAMALIPAILGGLLVAGIPSPIACLSLIWTLVMLMIFGWALACLFGISTVYIADIPNVMKVVLQILFYATPIIWREDQLRISGATWVLSLNPLAAFVDLIRSPLLAGHISDKFAAQATLVTVATLLTVGLAALSLSAFERKIVKHL